MGVGIGDEKKNGMEWKERVGCEIDGEEREMRAEKTR